MVSRHFKNKIKGNKNMCGICGYFNIKNREAVSKDILPLMLNAIQHRGPDGSDTFINNEVALGFCRLSFIDLRGGMQPICNEDRSVYMICNGEIYNYNELRSKLKTNGHVFKTNTDVEVIVHLYEDYGKDFPKFLNGQFAIVIYDSKIKKLLLVRDHMGIAPLFYTFHGGRVIFGSEIKAILEYPGVERRIELKAVDQVLNFPGIVAPITFFKNIYALRSGHIISIDAEGNIFDEEFWDLDYEIQNDDLGEEFYTEELQRLLIESIKKRLIADVPIGFYVSGGLDSSIIASYINKYITQTHDSFSAEVLDDKYSETFYQHMLISQIESKHHMVQVGNNDLWNHMEDVVYYTEAALRESYDVAAYLLSGLVNTTNVKAVLTGQGADEFFNGYVGYVSDFYRKMKKTEFSIEEQKVNDRLWGDPYFRYERNHYKLYEQNKEVYSKQLRQSLDEFSVLTDSPVDLSKIVGLNSQRRRSYIDAKLRLADHLLGDHGDRMFFSHSIEGRHPFLDKELIDFVIKMPEKYKLRGANEKYILKKIAEGIVPEAIIKRKKFAFSTPGMTYMLKQAPQLGEKYLNEDIIRNQGIFDVDYINMLKRQYLDPQFNLNGAYDLDYLQIALTVSILCETYQLTL